MATARSRKWLITINNPLEHGFDHARIKAAVLDLPSVVYWCMCDEQGDECETLHTHVFVVCENQVTNLQIDARFPSFHRDIARGKSAENRAYVLKDGAKFNKQPDGSYSYKDTGGHLHEGINFSDTFEEGGALPDERQGKSRDADKIVELIKAGASNEDIVDTVASAYRDLEKVERVRSMYRDAQFKSCWRNLEVTYIFGKTGSGKTRSVMDKYGYENCYRVTDYLPQSGRYCTGYRVCYRSDRTPQQSRRNAKHLPGIRLYRHYGGSPQSAVYRQTERQSHNEGAYP